jgi:predicted Zn-dependent protease
VKLAALLALAGCGTPSPCARHDADRCSGEIFAAYTRDDQLDVDPELERYVQGVADRVAAVSMLGGRPQIILSRDDNAYAVTGGVIVVGRSTVQLLGSEAELAGMIAHEIVHDESDLTPPRSNDGPSLLLDAEAIADERAVELLARAGYSPDGVARAIRAVVTIDDGRHPAVGDRIAHATALARGRPGGFIGRAELLRHLDGSVVGEDPRGGVKLADAWVVARLGLAIALPPNTTAQLDDKTDAIDLRAGDTSLGVLALGPAWGHEVAAMLEDATRDGDRTVGRMPAELRVDDSPVGKIRSGHRIMWLRPSAETAVAVIARPAGALVVSVGHGDRAELHRWLAGIRPATPHELDAAAPIRIKIQGAAKSGTIGELAADCVDPRVARELDDPARHVLAGEPIKCTDRVAATPIHVRPPPGEGRAPR